MTPTMSSQLESVLAAWLPGQRWYPAKGRTVALRVVADLWLGGTAAGPDPLVSVVILDLGLHGEPETALQVPVVWRRESLTGRADTFIGTVTTAAGPLHLHDGPHDPAYVGALDALLRRAETLSRDDTWVTSVPSRQSAAGAAPVVSSRVLTGEQSNTSVIVTPESGTGSIIKIFRSLQAGDNPDITLQIALAAAGSRRVAGPIGYIRGGWPGADGFDIVADLAFASEFLADAPDAWRSATLAVEAGREFTSDAYDLGAATAEVHRDLATALPTQPATPELLGKLAESLATRIAWAVEAAPELAQYEPGARAVADAVLHAPDAPAWQRIHGDLHLGQVLHPPGAGWVLLDFEGEPLRPLPERIALDSPLRDVAGMLRSFDYAARRVTVGLAPGPAADATVERADAWVTAARDAYCRGYADAAGTDPRSFTAVLAALELEKALYEVVYETRNRPSWLPIPLHAVARLLGGSPPQAHGLP